MVSFLQQTVSFDYDPLPSPQALRDNADIAGIGSVVSVDENLIQEEGEKTGAVIVTIHLDSVWKDTLGMGKENKVHLVLHRPTNRDASIFKTGLPTGAPIALFGYRFTMALDRDLEGPVIEPAPQGLILDDAGRSLNVWGDENAELPGWDKAQTLSGLEELMRSS